MSRKDYIAIAHAISVVREAYDKKVEEDAIRSIAWMLSDVLWSDNHRFDRQRFLAACGL